MRAAETSSTYSLVLFHLRVTPLALALVIVTLAMASAPTSAFRIVATAEEVMQCAQGYSGCGGVSMRAQREGRNPHREAARLESEMTPTHGSIFQEAAIDRFDSVHGRLRGC